MRTLKFIVEGQIIKQDPNCDFSGLIPGTDGYLQAEFTFTTTDWHPLIKAVGFYSMMGREYDAQLLDENNRCMIPAEACEKQNFKLKVVGKGTNGFKLTTNKFTVSQNGGNT